MGIFDTEFRYEALAFVIEPSQECSKHIAFDFEAGHI
jgi:hypothetical protein